MNLASTFLSPDSLLAPTLSYSTQAALRVAYGVLLLLTIAQASFERKRFFVSDRWGGYAQSSKAVDWIQNPVGSWVVVVVWMISALWLIFGSHPLVPSVVNLILARYFFIHMRWKGVLRGMGAPGFMTYWLAAVVFVLELASRYAPDARPLAILVAQVDFAFIMLSAGVYKLTAGYAQNHGMEYGLVNPEWGYWWEAYRRISPEHWLFTALNHLAWGTEVVAAILMLLPPTRLIGAALILVSFVFIGSQIRLGFLCEMVIAATLIFFYSSSGPALWLERIVPAASVDPGRLHPLASTIVTIALWTYLILLPLAHAGLSLNFYGRRHLPGRLQRLLEAYTNFFGLIIWRVFSVDVVNFYIVIHRQKHGAPASRAVVSRYGWSGGFRFSHVGESIAITSLFTTMKYYPSNARIFVDRLVRYSRTIPCAADEELVFEYVAIVKQRERFTTTTAAEFVVNPHAGEVSEQILNADISLRGPHAASPVHEGSRPGSYVPLRA